MATDEYPATEQADLCRVIGWLAGQPDDQRTDDAWSLTYDWGLEELEILGHPRLVVPVGASAPVASCRPSCATCWDLDPGGAGVPQPDQAAVRDRPEPMRPGEVEEVELELDATSWVFPAGHRLRLSLAGGDWPNLVSPPGPVTLIVDRDGSALTLPVLDGPSPGPGAVPPGPAGRPGADPPPAVGWRLVRDVLGRSEAEIDHGGRTELPDGTVLVERYRGTVGTGLAPGPTWARGAADYRIEWPEATDPPAAGPPTGGRQRRRPGIRRTRSGWAVDRSFSFCP